MGVLRSLWDEIPTVFSLPLLLVWFAVERVSPPAEEGGESSMRVLVKFSFPTTDDSNSWIRDGSMGPKMETMLGNIQPEAAYFAPVDGKRGGYLVINMDEASELVTKLEPLFQELGAATETFPVMVPDDMRAGLQGL
jgi:hypothetical protein